MLQWIFSSIISKHSWIHFSVQKGCIVPSMASLRGQKGLVWGRAEVSWSGRSKRGMGEPHNEVVLDITKYLKRHIVFCWTQLVWFAVLKRDSFLDKNIRAAGSSRMRKHCSHADLLAPEQQQGTKGHLQWLLCVSDDFQRLDLLCISFWWLLLSLSVLDIIQPQRLVALPSGPFGSWISVPRNASLVGRDREN